MDSTRRSAPNIDAGKNEAIPSTVSDAQVSNQPEKWEVPCLACGEVIDVGYCISCSATALRAIDEHTPKDEEIVLIGDELRIIGRWGAYCVYNGPRFTRWMRLPPKPIDPSRTPGAAQE